METGTQIILQRMIDCPEEFMEGTVHLGKWEKVLLGFKDILPTEDVEAIEAAYKQMRIDKFNELVLKTLAGEEPKQETVKYKAKERYGTGLTDVRGLFGNAAVKGEGQMVDYNLDARIQTVRQGLIESIGITTAHKGSSK
jgi:hypothetical protein